MTPETIKAAIKEISGYEEFNDRHWHRVGFDDLERILTRILCPAPAARHDSAGEGGRDRAGEMAAKIVSAFGYYADGGISITDRDLLRHDIVEALRIYGDEILDKAAATLRQRCVTDHASRVVLSLKSSPTGATHG